MVDQDERKSISEESRRNGLAEYTALRSEITTLLTIQVQFISYSVVLGSGLAGLFIAHRSFEGAAFFPLPFFVLGFLYGDAKARILRAARYISHELRPALKDSEADLGWESFIRKDSTLRPFMSFGEKLRWAAFMLPPLFPIIWLIWNPIHLEHGYLCGILFTIDLLVLVFLLWFAVRLHGHETKLLDEK